MCGVWLIYDCLLREVEPEPAGRKSIIITESELNKNIFINCVQ